MVTRGGNATGTSRQVVSSLTPLLTQSDLCVSKTPLLLSLLGLLGPEQIEDFLEELDAPLEESSDQSDDLPSSKRGEI